MHVLPVCMQSATCMPWPVSAQSPHAYFRLKITVSARRLPYPTGISRCPGAR